MHKANIKHKNPVFYIDPVCWMKLQEKDKNLAYTYRMRTYHFCAEACRRAFEANPEKYLNMKHKFPTLKTWWNRYLKRLEKATGGQNIKCH